MSPAGWPTLRSADGRREFACAPSAILGFIFNDAGELLLLSHPGREGAWEVVNGAIEAGESPVAALLRETSEEAGPDVQIRPVACVHAFLFRYDSRVDTMLSVAYAATYVGGDVVPGSDMEGSAVRWASPSTIGREGLRVIVPAQPWLITRAAAIHSLFRDDEVELEPWEGLTATEVSDALRAVVEGNGG